MRNVSFTKIQLKISSAKWWPFCPGADELNVPHNSTLRAYEMFLWVKVWFLFYCFRCVRVHFTNNFTIVIEIRWVNRFGVVPNAAIISLQSLHMPRHSRHVQNLHDDVITWKHFPGYWPFVRGIRRLPVNSPHKGQWRGASMFSLICAWINGGVNNREAVELRRHRAHYDVTVYDGKTFVKEDDRMWYRVIFTML